MVDEGSRYLRVVPGTLYCLTVAVFSFAAWSLYKPVSSLMWAFIFSILAGNLIRIPKSVQPGVAFCSTQILRGVIAMLGIVTSAAIWLRVGVGLFNAVAVILFSLLFAIWFGSKMGLSMRLSTLIGVGTSICGASAIAATAPAIGARDEEVGLSVAGITLFGLASMFLYPLLFLNTPVGQWLNGNINAYAIWVGSGVHETAQVVAAAGSLDADAVGPAMMVKSVRIFMIGPVILLATYLFSRGSEASGVGKSRLVLPMFGIVFILNTILSAILDLYSTQVVAIGLYWPSIKGSLSGTVFPFLLATAFSGVGSRVNFRSISKLGFRPFAVSALMALTAGVLAFVLAVIVSPFVS